MRFPATVRITREVDPNGLPVATAEIDVTEIDGSMPIPGGDQGDRGDQGDPQPAFRWMGDATPTELAQMNLQDSDRLKAWRDPATNNMHVWTGSMWKVSADVYGPVGPIGPATGLDVRDRDAGSDTASAELSGVAPDQSLILRIPRGLRGEKGAPAPAMPIRSTPDYDDTLAPKDGQIVYYTASSQQFAPTVSPRLVGPFVTSYQAGDATVGHGAEFVVGEMTVPALAFDWRPIIFGNVECGQTTDGWREDKAVIASVLMSQTDRSPITVARGLSIGGRGAGCAVIGPNMWDAMAPSDRNRVVSAGRSITFQVVLSYYGAAQMAYRQRRSNLTVWALPL